MCETETVVYNSIDNRHVTFTSRFEASPLQSHSWSSTNKHVRSQHRSPKLWERTYYRSLYYNNYTWTIRPVILPTIILSCNECCHSFFLWMKQKYYIKTTTTVFSVPLLVTSARSSFTEWHVFLINPFWSIPCVAMAIASHFTTELITRSAWVFWQNSLTVGFSLAPPLCPWQPKNFSRGSCEIRSLRKHFTPGRVKR